MRISDWSSDVCSSDLRGQVTQAVVYDPSRNELFTASRGSGTFLNDRRVRVSGRSRYGEALLGAHWPKSGDIDAGGGRFRQLAEGCTGVRRLGSTVLELGRASCRERVCLYV